MTIEDDFFNSAPLLGDPWRASWGESVITLLSPLDRTAAEVSAGVTPTNYQYLPGDVRRYGAAVDGLTDDSVAVHAAISTGLIVRFPKGVLRADTLDDTVIDTSVVLVGEPGAVIDGNNTGFFDFSNPGSTIDLIHVRGLEFQNMGGHVIRCFDAAEIVGTTVFTTIGRFEFENNYVHDSNSGIYLACKVSSLFVHGNRFKSLTAATSGCYGVHVGGNFFKEESFVDANVNTGSERITITNHVFINAEAVQLNNVGGTLPTGLALATTYYVKKIDANTIELYSDVGLTSIVDITAAAGGGTHYLFATSLAHIDDMKGYIVTDNEFDDLDAQTNGVECHAVLLYGRDASIANNVVRNIVNSGDGVSAEGIYTKMRFVSITGNTMIDAGTGEGYIVVKGGMRVSQSDNNSPPGYGAIVAHNKFYQSNGASDAQNGVYVQMQEAKIVDNYFEGLGGSCVETQNQLEYNNIEICRNMVRNHRGQYGFYIRHFGKGFKLNDNTVHGHLAHSGLGDCSSIELAGTASQGNWTNWEVCRNTVIDDGTCLATVGLRSINIAVNTSNTAYALKVAGNTMRNQQASITETGLNISTGTYVQLRVTDNDGQDVDGTSPLSVFATDIVDGYFANNVFVEPFIPGIVNVEWQHINCVLTNRDAGGAGRTLQLPVAIEGMEYHFIRANSGTMEVDPDGSETIRGTTIAGATVSLNAEGSCLTVRCDQDGTWEVLAANAITFN